MNVTKERKYDQHQNGRPNLWLELIAQMGDQLSACEQQSDETDAFVSANYALLREHRFFAALVPAEFGGSGVDYGDMSDILRVMAHYSPSTALAHSMHQHLVAANVFKHKKGQDVRGFLQKVADQQPVLISTGARDWLESNGTMTRTEGGYLLNAVKQFGSQSAEGGIAVTSAPYEDEQGDWHVLHFPVPLASDGVSLIENWEALGMRGTGSHAIKFEDVFVPDAAIALSRPRGTYHGVWNVVLTVAMPLIMSVYVGIAQKAAQIATDHVRQFPAPKPHQISAVGALNNELSIAEMALNDMLRINNNFDFTPTDACGHLILTRKSIIADAVIEVVNQAMDIVGGQAFYRRHPLEKLLRDVQGARYH
ncbi:MAG: acyl-CoA/acyl-ACP dehydrogenase, partial [Anaerolineae bacterium]|nr:acyl-CoA/acyl-ACP dehydrogenase [Anaerolineae bacterium]